MLTKLTHRAMRRLLALPALAVLSLSLSCARLPPTTNTLSGKRIRVTMQFASPLEPSFYYFFVINKLGAQGTTGAHGPVPVLSPANNGGYGNGFAAGSGTGTVNGILDYGLTDFVLYHNPQSQTNVNLYHFRPNADPNTQQYPQLTSQQLLNVQQPTNPDTGDTSGATRLAFDIDPIQLVTDTNDTAARIQEAKNIQFLQVNIIATDKIPIDPTTLVQKEVDAIGDTRDPAQQNSFLEIDLRQARTYTSTDNTSLLSPEPRGDVYSFTGGPGNSALDLVSWSIEIIPTN